MGTQLTPFQLADIGRHAGGWYDTILPAVRRYYSYSHVFIGMLAATSQNASVKANLTLAQRAYRQWKSNNPFVGFLPDVIINLNRTVAALPLKGDKIRAFHHAMLGDVNAVVVDRWIYRIYGKAPYAVVAGKLKADAFVYGWQPAKFQAAIWTGIKLETGRATDTEKSFAELLCNRGRQLNFV